MEAWYAHLAHDCTLHHSRNTDKMVARKSTLPDRMSFTVEGAR